MYLRILLFLLAGIGASSADTLHVAPSGSHAPPFHSWESAATTIQAAVDAAVAGDTVLVAGGTYLVPSPISVTNGITVASQEGADATIVQGEQLNPCFRVVHSNAVIDGFTIRNGHAGFSDLRGGGMWLDGGTVRNCSFRYNTSVDEGGGLFLNRARAENCFFMSNTCWNGGGVFASNGVLLSCVIVMNHAQTDGGGAMLAGNESAMLNCTISDNTADSAGGGVYVFADAPLVQNSIVYGNSATFGPNYFNQSAQGRFSYCCTFPQTNAAGNITNGPSFANPAAGDYQLTADSPCLDSGTNIALAAATTDIRGQKRIFNQRVDMGAYEGSIRSAGVDHTDGVQTTWDVLIQARCQLQGASDARAPAWTNVGSVVTATQSRITLTDTNEAPARIYRLLWLQ